MLLAFVVVAAVAYEELFVEGAAAVVANVPGTQHVDAVAVAPGDAVGVVAGVDGIDLDEYDALQITDPENNADCNWHSGLAVHVYFADVNYGDVVAALVVVGGGAFVTDDAVAAAGAGGVDVAAAAFVRTSCFEVDFG